MAAKINKLGKLILLSLLLFINPGAFSQSPSYTSNPLITIVDVEDADGNLYKTVRLGDQVWMAENLRTTKYKDGTAIPLVTGNKDWSDLTTPGYCRYNNKENVSSKSFGALYNWYAVNTGNLCPEGWHVPKDTEWPVLEKYLIAGGYDYEGITTGNKIAKSLAAAEGWTISKNKGAVGNTDYPEKRNATGFSALPGGYRYNDGTFNGAGTHVCWWYATDYDAESAWGRNLLYFYDSIHRGISSKKNGYSVRCLKD